MAVQLVLLALQDATEQGILNESDITQDRLEAFLSKSGREFYKLPIQASRNIVLERRLGREEVVKIPKSIKSANSSVEVGVSRAGAEVFALSWA